MSAQDIPLIQDWDETGSAAYITYDEQTDKQYNTAATSAAVKMITKGNTSNESVISSISASS